MQPGDPVEPPIHDRADIGGDAGDTALASDPAPAAPPDGSPPGETPPDGSPLGEAAPDGSPPDDVAPDEGPTDGSGPTRRPRRVPLALATWVLIALVLAVVVVLLVVKITRGSTVVVSPPVTAAPAGVVQALASVPASAYDAAGTPSASAVVPPTVLHGQPPLTVDGRPGVVFVGAEFCPYCAAERWALVAALSRFGHFDDLGATSSTTEQVFPGVRTFSFDGATYRSPLVGLSAVELYGDQPSQSAPAGYATLHRLDGLQQSVMQRYDRAGAVADPGALPFLDVGNVVVLSGSQIGFSPGLLEGLSMGQIASDLTSPQSPVADAVLGAANEITAAICAVTDGRPDAVCSTSGVRRGARQLGLP